LARLRDLALLYPPEITADTAKFPDDNQLSLLTYDSERRYNEICHCSDARRNGPKMPQNTAEITAAEIPHGVWMVVFSHHEWVVPNGDG
jgi:hypothetical protein